MKAHITGAEDIVANRRRMERIGCTDAEIDRALKRKLRVHLEPRGETRQEQFFDRHNRPVEAIRGLVKKAMLMVGLDVTKIESVSWSRYAGCTACPCSPGFIVKGPFMGHTVHASFVASVDAADQGKTRKIQAVKSSVVCPETLGDSAVVSKNRKASQLNLPPDGQGGIMAAKRKGKSKTATKTKSGKSDMDVAREMVRRARSPQRGKFMASFMDKTGSSAAKAATYFYKACADEGKTPAHA